ncbi:hypothetical protein FVEG_15642 [Fusarium verticillioides 7600]|uniref:Uncharacterized protein n=1 Tax=Gibberella moniliformis (strain M3125 / FGSC 7600) TaxID=334819 RepID=W7MA15_GIBM7|nr:hypothetical protein FVEG_15642 [Fusarium verticillioides 7600]EWG44390.1 hypothetical protein FVEG_15642 [Fusarium verticillioides 7600]
MSSFSHLKGPNTQDISNFESESNIDRRFSSQSSSKSRADNSHYHIHPSRATTLRARFQKRCERTGVFPDAHGGMCRGSRTTLPGEVTKGGKKREAQETSKTSKT